MARFQLALATSTVARPPFHGRSASSSPHGLVALVAATALWTTVPGIASFPALGATSGVFQRLNDPAGGTIVTGTLGRSSLPAATAALLREVHAELRARPRIVQVAQNARTHSLALLFTDVGNGTSYTGIAIVTAAPGAQASGAALYDTSTRFHSTIGPLMHRLGAITSAASAPATAQRLAPAQPLVRHAFSDGTGSIGIPAGWRLTMGGGGSAAATGPNAQLVQYNVVYSGADPNDPSVRFLMRTWPPAIRAGFVRRNAMEAYTGDPVQAWNTMFAQLAAQNGTRPPHFSVSKVTRSGNGAAEIIGTVSFGKGPGGAFDSHVFLLPPIEGVWSMHVTAAWMPRKFVWRDAATEEAVLRSVRINFRALNSQQNAIRKMYQDKFEVQLGIAREETAARTARVDEAMANDRAAQEGMHREAVSMENYSLDRAVVVDNRNGVHSTVDSGFADTLVREDSNYQKVPAQGLLRGIDY